MQKAQQATFEVFDASQWRIGIVVAQFNNHITDKSYESALKRAKDYKISPDNIKTIKVIGAIEIPLALQSLAQSKQYDALLAIGCVIKGDTPHFDYVCNLVTEGVLRVQLDNNMPIGFGILTCDNEAQAVERSDLAGEHLEAALQLAKALKS